MKKVLSYTLITLLTISLSNAQKESKFKPSIKDVSEINMVYYSFTGPYDQSFNNFDDLMAYLQQNNMPIGAHSLGIFYDNPEQVAPNKLRSEIGFMVNEKVHVSGNYKFKNIPGSKAVSCRYKNNEDLKPAYQAIEQYITANNLKTEPYSVEIYYSADPAVIDAEILMFIKE